MPPIKPDGTLDIPMSPKFKREYGKVSIKVPRNLRDKKIKEIRIIPKYNARYFEIQYSYEIPESKLELNKTCSYIIKYCINNDIGNIIIGYNPTIQRESNIGKKNNQNFVNLPLGDIASKLEYLSKRNNINFIKQEESYTSKSDFLANDPLPIINPDNPKKYTFSGKRISRGQYKSSTGIIINADVNGRLCTPMGTNQGSLNILRKSNIVNLSHIQENPNILKQPVRIKIA